MKKNGFTLVEMLAVIALVGFLAVVGVATYTRVNESAKQKTLDSKKEEIRASAMKWAKENNITNKTLISVNALVVEGYLTAEENKVGEIALIENPVTGENMICNTVDISFKQGEMVAEVDDKTQNCELATQSLVDTKINIQVIDADGHNKTGGTNSSISNWTNENVMIVVSSTEYDPNAVSISFDFEGNTTTKPLSGLSKYTGSGYLNSDQAKAYYNVFNVDGNLLLNSKVVVSYALTDGTVKSRAYTIRIDKEEATASVKSNNEWMTTDKPIYVLVDDGKGSGPKYFYVTTSPTGELNDGNKYAANYEGTATNLEVGKYYIWTEDNAGNRSSKYKVILEVNNVDKTVPECEVIFEGTVGDHGWFKENPVQPYGHNTVPAGISGINVGVNQLEDVPAYTAFAYFGTDSMGMGDLRDTNTEKAGELYWCHAKTLAGNYAKNSKRLYLDMTPPTISVSVTEPNTHTQTKTATVKIQDALSGLNASTTIKYGFSLSNTTAPTTWHDFVITTSAQNNSLVTDNFTTSDKLTGTYYMWFDISGFTDYAGNHPKASAEGTIRGNMIVYGPYKFDNTPPKCNGNNGKTNWTKGEYTIYQYCIDNVGTNDQSLCAQDTYTINYGSDRTVKTDKVTIYDKAHNSTVCDYNVYLDNTPPVCDGRGGKTNWTKGTYTVVQKCSEDANAQSGCAQATFTKYYGNTDTYKSDVLVISDKVNNTTVCNTDVYLDNTPPVCGSTTGENSSWSQAARTVYVNCSDGTNQSGCTQLLFSKTHADTTMKDTITIKDNVDNQTVCGAYNYYVDVTKPVCGTNNGKTNWTKGGYTITVGCSDGTDQSGCTSNPFTRVYTALQTVKGDSLTISDGAGNTQSCSYNVYIDNTAPTCDGRAGKTNWTKGSYTVKQKCSDGTNQSGCSSTSFPVTFTTTTKTSSIQISDNVSNTTTCGVDVYLDNTAPSCGNATGQNDTYTRTAQTVTVECVEDTDAQSGCSKDSFSKKHSDTTVSDSITINDKVGNTATCGPYNYYVDVTKPTCGADNGKTNWTKGSFEGKVGCSDGNSGCTQESYTKTWSSTTTSSSIRITDNAGNYSSCPINVYLDNSKPTCSGVKTDGIGSTTGVSGSISCNDNHSGVSSCNGGNTTFSNRKSSVSFTVKDNVGNVGSCSVGISGYGCNWDDCLTTRRECASWGYGWVVHCQDRSGGADVTCSNGCGVGGDCNASVASQAPWACSKVSCTVHDDGTATARECGCGSYCTSYENVCVGGYRDTCYQ